jgi:hypothetical protein
VLHAPQRVCTLRVVAISSLKSSLTIEGFSLALRELVVINEPRFLSCALTNEQSTEIECCQSRWHGCRSRSGQSYGGRLSEPGWTLWRASNVRRAAISTALSSANTSFAAIMCRASGRHSNVALSVSRQYGYRLLTADITIHQEDVSAGFRRQVTPSVRPHLSHHAHTALHLVHELSRRTKKYTSVCPSASVRPFKLLPPENYLFI